MSNPRIEQFRKMTEADPTNELGHFSLGRALLDDKQYEPAIASFRKALELNGNLSKVYQLIAQAQLELNQKDEAIASLQQGAQVANQRGDLLPRNEMVGMLKELGAPVPDFGSQPSSQAVGEGQVMCSRCGRPGPKLAKAPFRGAFGEQILQNVCTACWREAIAMGTKVINELRLPMADPQAQKIWDQHIREFLNLTR
jgi:Fe-S cluster biosynthesis and repair protein YggX